jgi:tetratricopeptide (TPR) repeat protein
LIDDGANPISSQPYTKMGSYMANVLSQEERGQLAAEHEYGSIQFFSDYVRLCNQKHRKDASCQFPDDFQKTLAAWSNSWKITAASKNRNLTFDLRSTPDSVETQMRPFDSARAYPDYSREISDLGWTFLTKGENEKSLQFGEISTHYYPENARALALYGISLAAVSDRSRGIALLKKAYQMDREGPAEPSYLSEFVETLAKSGRVDESTKLMQIAVELYPKDPTLERTKSVLEKMKP